MERRVSRKKARMFQLVLLLVMVAVTIIGMLLRPKSHGPLASSLGDFQFPTASEGRAIPVVFGTVKIGGGNTVWWGDLTVKPIKQGSWVGYLMGSAPQTVGYKYFIGVQYVLCQGPVDALISIECESKVLTHSVDFDSDPRKLWINDDNIFGGTPTGQGGLAGALWFYRGTETQIGDDYLSLKQTGTTLQETGVLPAFSGPAMAGSRSFLPAALRSTRRSPSPRPARSTRPTTRSRTTSRASSPSSVRSPARSGRHT